MKGDGLDAESVKEHSRGQARFLRVAPVGFTPTSAPCSGARARNENPTLNFVYRVSFDPFRVVFNRVRLDRGRRAKKRACPRLCSLTVSRYAACTPTSR